MRLNEINYRDGQPVEGYGAGFFRVGGDVIHGGLLILPGHVRSWGGYDDIEDILAAAERIDVLFVGTGAETRHVPAPLRAQMDDAGVGLEPTASPAACRTYNILLSEGRRIGLAALPVVPS